MGFDRREFLRIAGLSALAGLGVGSAFELVYPGQVDAADVMRNPARIRGTHWSMAVDITLFKSEADTEPLVKTCNYFHNIPTIPNKKNIKWIWPTSFAHAFTDQDYEFVPDEVKGNPVMLMCNHCTNPPCVRVCPTQATFKRKQDGIVMMDMHRCIGCRFCMAACPYGSRSFNFYDPRKWLPDGKPFNPEYPTRTKGVVEKCDFCVERLAVGKMPACVEAAKPGQLLFGDLNDPRSTVRKALRERYSIRRKPSLGTEPNVYYLV